MGMAIIIKKRKEKTKLTTEEIQLKIIFLDGFPP